jgi:hypothetical protein
MRWEMGFSASEIASTAFSNPKIFRAREDIPPHAHPAQAFDPWFVLRPQWISLRLIYRDWRVTFTTLSPTGEGRL